MEDSTGDDEDDITLSSRGWSSTCASFFQRHILVEETGVWMEGRVSVSLKSSLTSLLQCGTQFALVLLKQHVGGITILFIPDSPRCYPEISAVYRLKFSSELN